MQTNAAAPSPRREARSVSATTMCSGARDVPFPLVVPSAGDSISNSGGGGRGRLAVNTINNRSNIPIIKITFKIVEYSVIL